ncbi:MAG: class I SAM-dependent methyltransferase [Chloroflexi bacterium]|nr:MAG: class I SAM-dependent methyltransferase [Chloroflexota bacterium]MBL1193184.1 class I SAM-dependent methyltransferase [Chloroflexota bacterium]NOH10478.1 class I SAM-dependent methyltransferase [Chloroflexota bacterium]
MKSQTLNIFERYTASQRLHVAEETLLQLQQRMGKTELSVVELGCGYYGRNLFYLRDRFPDANFLGVDLKINPGLYKYEGVYLLQADLNNWQPVQNFDCVLSLAVTEHLAEINKHFSLIESCMTNQGRAVVTSPLPQAHFLLWFLSRLRIFNPQEIDDHKLYLTRTGLQRYAQQAGLHIQGYRTISFAMHQAAILGKNNVKKT